MPSTFYKLVGVFLVSHYPAPLVDYDGFKMAESQYHGPVTGVLSIVFGYQHVKACQKHIELSGQKITIGKAANCEVQLLNAVIMDNADFTYSNGWWSVCTNETVCVMKNGKELRDGKALLETGDIIAFGKNVPLWYCFKYAQPSWLKCARGAHSDQEIWANSVTSGAFNSASQRSLKITSHNASFQPTLSHYPKIVLIGSSNDDKRSKPSSATITGRLTKALETTVRKNFVTYSRELFFETWRLHSCGFGWVELDIARQHCLNHLTREIVKQSKNFVTIKEQTISKSLEYLEELLNNRNTYLPSNLQFAFQDCYMTIMKCPVCQCTSVDPVKIICGHTFCKSCTASVFLCPLCHTAVWTSHGLNALGL